MLIPIFQGQRQDHKGGGSSRACRRGRARERKGRGSRGGWSSRGCLAFWQTPGPFLRQSEEGPRPISIQNLKDKHKHTALTLSNRAKGRQKGKGPPYEVGVECGQEVDPHNMPALIFLSGQDICDEVVPVEEPPVPENVQDFEH